MFGKFDYKKFVDVISLLRRIDGKHIIDEVCLKH